MPLISSTGAQTVGPASGGKVTAFNSINTTPAQVIAGNPSRVSITFHAPGSIDILVAPTRDANNAVLTPSTVNLGGCFRIFAGGDRAFSGECQQAWQAFSISGSSQPLTVMESNV